MGRFSSRERNGVLAVMTICLAVTIAGWLVRSCDARQNSVLLKEVRPDSVAVMPSEDTDSADSVAAGKGRKRTKGKSGKTAGSSGRKNGRRGGKVKSAKVPVEMRDMEADTILTIGR